MSIRRETSAEAEIRKEMLFESHGPWWHLYTPGIETPVYLTSEEDFVFAMNLVALCNTTFPSLKTIAFTLMNNHLHMVISGTEEMIPDMFAFLRKKLSRYLTQKRGFGADNNFKGYLKPIKDLKSLRNTIAYVNRNGYVADHNHTPYTYKWGTGRYYFNDICLCEKLSGHTDFEIRSMFKGRNPRLPEDYYVIDGHVSPTSYCSIGMGMEFFKDAHQYFNLLTKNVEAYQEIAVEINDSEFMTDTELFSQISRIIENQYNVTNTRQLSDSQRNELATKLHYDFRSSNSQIRRVTGLSQGQVDALFPLSQKPHK